MGIQTVRERKQPGETLRYSMEFKPGVALGDGDSLSGTPTVKVFERPANTDKTSDMLEGTPQTQSNIVYFKIKGGTSGKSYKVSIKSDTANGEKNVEEDLIIFVEEL